MKSSFAYLVGGLIFLMGQETLGQVEAIHKRLEEFKINDHWLAANLKEVDAIHYYKVKTVTGSNHGNVTSIAEYDPRRKEGKRLQLLSIDGHKASKIQEKKYYKRIGDQFESLNGKIDSLSYKVIKDNENWFVVDFRLDKESLPEHYKFLGDCTAELHCRKDLMRASYARFQSFQPTKVRMFAADKVDLEVYFKYDEATGSYIHDEAHYYMEVNMLGIPTEVEMFNYYSDYEVVK